MAKHKIPVQPDPKVNVYKKMRISQVSNYYIWKFVKSKDKNFKIMRKLYKKEYRYAYMLAQKRGLITL